jgi:hypothetical protein
MMKSSTLLRLAVFSIVLVALILLGWFIFFQPTPRASIETGVDAIHAIQAEYSEVSNIKIILTPQPFESQWISIKDKDYGWDIIFFEGSGDCPAGCLNNYFWYFTVHRDGKIIKAGEYSRVFQPVNNSYQETGVPLWGYPR